MSKRKNLEDPGSIITQAIINDRIIEFRTFCDHAHGGTDLVLKGKSTPITKYDDLVIECLDLVEDRNSFKLILRINRQSVLYALDGEYDSENTRMFEDYTGFYPVIARPVSKTEYIRASE